MYKFDAVINNKFIEGKERLNILDPTTLQTGGTVAVLDEQDIDNAF